MGTEASNPPPESRVQVEAVQTVTPWRSSGPRSPRRVTASPAALAEAMQSRACVVLAYARPVVDGNGWDLAGRLKESLNIALSEQPVVAGRLRRADAGVEVRLTDSGVRLVQARAGAPMAEFLRDEGAARDLAYWADLDEKAFEYSPLFFVQLTVFERQGYSIGVSGSLLVTDPGHLCNFVKAWSRVHAGMRFSQPSIFHLSNFRRSSSPLSAAPAPIRRHTTLFFAPSHVIPHPVTLFDVDSSGDLAIRICEEQASMPPEGGDEEEVEWVENVGLDEVGFEEGLWPAHAFCFLESHGKGNMAVKMPFCNGSAGAVVVGLALPETVVGT